MDSLKEITSTIEPELNLFEKNLKTLLNKEDNFLKEDLISFMFNKPKRLRPLFIFLFSKLLKIDDSLNCALIQKIASITELIHSASLIHDDIIDNSIKRRLLDTFYKKFGAKIAVLEGDLLLSIALMELSNTNLEILKIFSDKIKDTLNGEINQNANFKKITSVELYFDKTFKKTGNLFLAGILALLTLKEIDEKTKEKVIGFIKNYSIAFQIQNDIKDYYLNNSDFLNGNYTLAVIYFFMENKNSKPTLKNIQKYIKMAELKKDEFKNKAVEFLVDFDDNKYKNAILKLCNYTLES